MDPMQAFLICRWRGLLCTLHSLYEAAYPLPARRMKDLGFSIPERAVDFGARSTVLFIKSFASCIVGRVV